MALLDIGRVCIKTKGREAGKKAVIVEVLENSLVLIDGTEVKRRKCNPKHLLPTNERIKIAKKAPHTEVIKAMRGNA